MLVNCSVLVVVLSAVQTGRVKALLLLAVDKVGSGFCEYDGHFAGPFFESVNRLLSRLSPLFTVICVTLFVLMPGGFPALLSLDRNRQVSYFICWEGVVAITVTLARCRAAKECSILESVKATTFVTVDGDTATVAVSDDRHPSAEQFLYSYLKTRLAGFRRPAVLPLVSVCFLN